MNLCLLHTLLRAPPANVQSKDEFNDNENKVRESGLRSVLVTSGSKLVAELCVALRLCLYAVNTSEARTLMNNALVILFFLVSSGG